MCECDRWIIYKHTLLLIFPFYTLPVPPLFRQFEQYLNVTGLDVSYASLTFKERPANRPELVNGPRQEQLSI